MEKLYELGEDGSFKPFQANIIFPTIPSTRGRLLHPKRTIYKAYMQFNGNEEKALPFHISQIVVSVFYSPSLFSCSSVDEHSMCLGAEVRRLRVTWSLCYSALLSVFRLPPSIFSLTSNCLLFW